MEVLARLSAEHDALRTHLERIQSAAEARDAAALSASLEAAHAALTDELDAHIAMEEAQAFSVIAETLGNGLVAPFREEHIEIRTMREEMYASLTRGEPPYQLSLHMCELILAHQQREDLMLFPSVRDLLIR